ncbi:uncharacterized protein LOC133888029 isoform X2 [Phragmites australis]|uniref:uncharacterized protein LOC133888029 isoform X2 n=1 Tax=Phragmites australis TaxID=29695 RepID=UPI002D78E66B|nr:uncharacterized protein LOC133888029 isoform X2 [Phragmites australis]
MALPPLREFVEVRCAGCGETLEVEPGLTEFACPDCGTQQALPPELMPPPRPRRALPIPGRGPPAAATVPVLVPAPARMPCGACAALLSVPAGLVRFACPLCGVELVVDGGRLQVYLASPAPAIVSVVAPPPAGITLTSPHRRPEGQVERYNHPIRSVHREETYSSSRTDTRETIYTMLAQKGPGIHSVHREEPRIESLNKTMAKSSVRKTKLPACPESTGVEKVRPEPPIHASSASRAQARPPSYSVCRDRARGQRPVEDIASHEQQINEYPAVSSNGQHNQIEPSNQDNCVEQAQGEYQGKTTGWNPKRKRSGKSASGNQKGEKKGLTSSPNEELHLRRSTRLSKLPEQPINDEPVEQPAASSNRYNSDPLHIDKIIANLCPSPLPQHQMPQASSNPSGQVDAATGPPLSNHDTSQAGQFPLCYSQMYPPEVRGTHRLDRSGEEQPHSPEARCHVMHVQQSVPHSTYLALTSTSTTTHLICVYIKEDAQRGHSVLGSVVKSSGKRRGRGHQPTKLIDTRREVDRPVLTPNIIDKWDVNPACPKVASTITVLLKQKYPGSTYLPAGQRREVPPNGEVILHWHQYPPETRAAILNEFLQRYKWAPGREAECLKLFERRAARQFAGLLSEEKRKVRAKLAAVQRSKEASSAHRSNRQAESEEEAHKEEPEDQQTLERSDSDDPLLWKPFPPAWMYPNWWERLCEHWAKEEVLKMSSQNRKNRYNGGRAHHTSGSRSIAMHRQVMVIENGGMPVSELEVFSKTHRRNGGTGEFVSERAKRTVEGFKKRMEEAGDKQIDPHLAWALEVGRRNRGRYYGLTGIIDKDKLDELAKSMPDYFGKKGRQQKFTQEQVQQMINQALQGLNETWEKKFKSLEQSVLGAPPLGIDPKHAPGSSAVGEGGQEDRSRHQDTSDSQHGESHEDNDAEVVSTSV